VESRVNSSGNGQAQAAAEGKKRETSRNK
jgi:hypothetical protein